MKGHGAHLGTLIGPVLLVAFWAAWADLRAWLHRSGPDLPPAAALVAAALSVGAAAIHALVTPAHAQEDLLYGAFFAVVFLAQAASAVALVTQRSRRLLAGVAAGNLAVVGLWAVTRTAGIPLGTAAGTREPVGILDLTSCLLELGTVVCCLAVLHARRPVSLAV